MKILARYSLQRYYAGIVSLIMLSGQLSTAQTYLNINFLSGSNKYSVLTDVSSITFNGSGGIVFKKTDNSVSTETMNLLSTLTLDGTSGGGAALPVELVSFRAESKFGNTDVMWTTATERDNYGFEIERRAVSDHQLQGDGHVAWTKTGFIEGSGTTNAPKEYSYTDKNLAPGKYLYRLKQIDRDGKFEYSNEVEVTVTDAPMQFAMEQNYPNPFNPSTAISYQLSVSGMTTLVIYDALGRKAATLVSEIKDGGNYSVSFDGSNLASGIYYAQLTSDGKMQMRKLVLLK